MFYFTATRLVMALCLITTFFLNSNDAANAQDGAPVFASASISGHGDAPVIRITSNNRESWTSIADGELQLKLRVRIAMQKGRLRRYFLGPGRWGTRSDAEFIQVRARGLEKIRETHTLSYPLSSYGIGSDELLARCNNLLALGKDVTKPHYVPVEIPIKMRAVARRRANNGKGVTRTLSVWGSAPVTLECAPLRRRASRVRVTDFYLTIPQEVRGRCPQDVSMEANIISNRPGKFRYRFVREDGSTTPYYNTRTTKQQGKAVAVSEHVIKIQKPINVRYRMEIEGLQRTSDWTRLNVRCKGKRAPQSGAVVANDALLVVNDPGGNSCPRTVILSARVRTNQPGPVTAKLERDDGWSSAFFTINSELKNNGRYIATYKRNLNIDTSHRFKYRVVVKRNKLKSSWKGVNVNCDNVAATPSAPMQIKSLHLKISSTNLPVCPSKGTLRAVIETSKPGLVRFHLVRNDGTISSEIRVNARKYSNGKIIALYDKEFLSRRSVNTKYQIKLVGLKLTSAWAPLQVKCLLSVDKNNRNNPARDEILSPH